MDVEVIESDPIKLLGMEYYGTINDVSDENNEINDLWGRFSDFCKLNWELIEDKVINEKYSYEMHIWKEEAFKESGAFRTFIGVDVKDFDYIPIDLTAKVIPASTYVNFKLRGQEINEWEDLVYNQWLPDSDYYLRMVNGYLYDYQRYDEEEFKGVENLEDSELDVYVPIFKE